MENQFGSGLGTAAAAPRGGEGGGGGGVSKEGAVQGLRLASSPQMRKYFCSKCKG